MLELKTRNVLQLGDKGIPYIVTRSDDSKHIQLRLRPDFELEVTIPSDPEVDVNALLEKKRKWIERKYDEIINSKRIFEGKRVLFKGEYHDVNTLVGVESREALKKWMKSATEKLVREKLTEYERKFKLSSNGFLVKEMKKWAHCTKDRRLFFNWQLTALPEDLVDYVILHELTHLIEFSHSRRFRYSLASICPDFKERELMLKRFIAL